MARSEDPRRALEQILASMDEIGEKVRKGGKLPAFMEPRQQGWRAGTAFGVGSTTDQEFLEFVRDLLFHMKRTQKPGAERWMTRRGLMEGLSTGFLESRGFHGWPYVSEEFMADTEDLVGPKGETWTVGGHREVDEYGRGGVRRRPWRLLNKASLAKGGREWMSEMQLERLKRLAKRGGPAAMILMMLPMLMGEEQ